MSSFHYKSLHRFIQSASSGIGKPVTVRLIASVLWRLTSQGLLISYLIALPSLVHAEIRDDRLLSLIDHAIPEGAGGDHGSQAAISEDRQFVFFAWDNHETAYHNGLSLLDSGLAVYDISNVKAPRLVIEKRLGPHVILGALVSGQHLFLSWLNPTDAPHSDWTRDVVVFDIKSPGLLSELDRVGHISVLMKESISPDGNVIKTDDDIYHDVTRHTDVLAPAAMQNTLPREFEYIEGHLITDTFGPYALTVDSLMNECSIWHRSTSASPLLIRKFKPGDRSACFGKMAPDFNSLLVHEDFQLRFYSTKSLPVTARRLRRTFKEASADVASDPRSWRQQDNIQEAVSQLDGAGIDVLISGGLRGMGGKERAHVLTEYSRWYMEAYGFHSAERAAMIMRKAVQSDPASAEAAALLGAVDLDAVFPATTDSAKAAFWDESRRSFANYRRLIGDDPRPLEPTVLSDPHTGALFTSARVSSRPTDLAAATRRRCPSIFRQFVRTLKASVITWQKISGFEELQGSFIWNPRLAPFRLRVKPSCFR